RSYISGTDQGQSFVNVAMGFRTTTAHALHPGQDVAYFVDSPGSDVFSGEAGVSYMYSLDAHGGFTEFDAAYGFSTVFAASVNGGLDLAYNHDPAHTILTGRWVLLSGQGA